MVNRREFLAATAAAGVGASGCLHEDSRELPEYSRWLYDSGDDSYQSEYVRPRRIAPVITGESRFLGIEVVTTEAVVLPNGASVERFVPGEESSLLDSEILDGEPDEMVHGFEVHGTRAVDLESNFYVEARDRETLGKVLAAGADREDGRPENDADLAEALRLLGEADVVIAGSGGADVAGGSGVAGGLSMTIAEEDVEVVHCTVFESSDQVDAEAAEGDAGGELGSVEEVRRVGRSVLVSGRAEADVIAPFVTYGII